MDVKEAIALRKNMIRQAKKESDRAKRTALFDAAEDILEQIDKARANGTAINDIKTTDDAYGLMGL